MVIYATSGAPITVASQVPTVGVKVQVRDQVTGEYSNRGIYDKALLDGVPPAANTTPYTSATAQVLEFTSIPARVIAANVPQSTGRPGDQAVIPATPQGISLAIVNGYPYDHSFERRSPYDISFFSNDAYASGGNLKLTKYACPLDFFTSLDASGCSSQLLDESEIGRAHV